ncbi:MAG: AraC family transcriptional regulator [Gammaproteobacteria bacterium]|nr:AraC family transcriptional regulator [Gammaproteobacteria bacterium]
MSALDDFLRLLQLQCSVYHNQQVCGDWLLEEHAVGQTCFHLVSHGECILDVGGHETALRTGDVVLFPREIRHRLVPISPPGYPGERHDLSEKWRPDATGLLCAAIRFEHRASEQLLDAWPEYLIVRHHSEAARWLMPVLEQLVAVSRSGGPGSEVIVDRLAEVVFMEVVRHCIRDARQPVGFLTAYTDPALSRAMKGFHESPDEPWTLEKAAGTAHMSRARFARTFKVASGWTWRRYQTWWRMQLAWSALSKGESVLSVAQSVGYQSEAAFSRTFRRHFGMYAGEVRRGVQFNGVGLD